MRHSSCMRKRQPLRSWPLEGSGVPWNQRLTNVVRTLVKVVITPYPAMPISNGLRTALTTSCCSSPPKTSRPSRVKMTTLPNPNRVQTIWRTNPRRVCCNANSASRVSDAKVKCRCSFASSISSAFSIKVVRRLSRSIRCLSTSSISTITGSSRRGSVATGDWVISPGESPSDITDPGTLLRRNQRLFAACPDLSESPRARNEPHNPHKGISPPAGSGHWQYPAPCGERLPGLPPGSY